MFIATSFIMASVDSKNVHTLCSITATRACPAIKVASNKLVTKDHIIKVTCPYLGMKIIDHY